MSNNATRLGTLRYVKRFSASLSDSHFREAQNLMFSSIGIGTYLGNNDEATDGKYANAITKAVESGVNHIDTAINYRFQRSERAVGEALKGLFEENKINRDEVIVATKVGYIPFDGAPPEDYEKYFIETFLARKIIGPKDIVRGIHCMTPRYIRHQLGRSLKNLGLSGVDIYYLHNPEEQLQEISRDEFNDRILKAFELFEQMVNDGLIRFYGIATWNGFSEDPNSKTYLSLSELVKIAEKVGGPGHRFRFVQMPFNLAMLGPMSVKNQKGLYGITTILESAWEHNISVIASSSLLQSQLTKDLPEFLAKYIVGLETDAQRAIQFARSTPGITSALVGMSNVKHVVENMEVAKIPLVDPDTLARLLKSTK